MDSTRLCSLALQQASAITDHGGSHKLGFWCRLPQTLAVRQSRLLKQPQQTEAPEWAFPMLTWVAFKMMLCAACLDSMPDRVRVSGACVSTRYVRRPRVPCICPKGLSMHSQCAPKHASQPAASRNEPGRMHVIMLMLVTRLIQWPGTDGTASCD